MTGEKEDMQKRLEERAAGAAEHLAAQEREFCSREGAALPGGRSGELAYAAGLLRSLGRWRAHLAYLGRMQEQSAVRESFYFDFEVYERRKNNWFELEEKRRALSQAIDRVTEAFLRLGERDQTVLRQVFLIGDRREALRRNLRLSDSGFRKACRGALIRLAKSLARSA